MNAETVKILIIEDYLEDASLVKEYLLGAGYNSDNIILENTLHGGLTTLSVKEISIVLTDLVLPDSKREDTIKKIVEQNSEVPIIILSEIDDQKIAIESVNKGVQDYLIKGSFDSNILSHSIQYALLRFDHKRKIRELSDFKSKLFRIVSHDLKGPMGALYSYVEMMIEDLDQMPKETLREDLNCLEEISKSLLNLIENLFNWARIQVGSIEIKPEVIEVNNLVSENISISKLQAANKNITIENNVPENIFVYADKDMINTVIRNLIFNAIKFTNLGGAVDISCQKKNDFYQITIEDNGIGIEGEKLDQIFNNCNFVQSVGTNHEKGSGLGLTLCKEFIEHNHGKIWVNSKINAGSKFSFSLPIGNFIKLEKNNQFNS